MHYWFKRFTPISPWGWAVYLLAAVILLWDFKAIDQTSRSASETLFTFFPHIAGMFLLVAIIIKSKNSNNEK